jgi:hypothetical protein
MEAFLGGQWGSSGLGRPDAKGRQKSQRPQAHEFLSPTCRVFADLSLLSCVFDTTSSPTQNTLVSCPLICLPQNMLARSTLPRLPGFSHSPILTCPALNLDP